MIRKKNMYSILLIFVFLFGTGLYAKSIKDKYGKEFFSKKKEVHYSTFKRVKQSKIPVYSKKNVTSDLIKYLDALEFVELVDGKLGVSFAKIRAYHKLKGYIEGYTKVSFFFKKKYYSEPFELSELEVARLKELSEKRINLKKKRERRKIEREREQLFNEVILSSRENVLQVLGMTFKDIVSYLKDTGYKLDNQYNINASKTVKFESSVSSIYFTFLDKNIVGFKIISNTEGFTEKELYITLYETVGEIYHSIDKIEEINESIIKKFGIMNNTKQNIIIKADKTKDNPILEITIGDFSGIE